MRKLYDDADTREKRQLLHRAFQRVVLEVHNVLQPKDVHLEPFTPPCHFLVPGFGCLERQETAAAVVLHCQQAGSWTPFTEDEVKAVLKEMDAVSASIPHPVESLLAARYYVVPVTEKAPGVPVFRITRNFLAKCRRDSFDKTPSS